MKQCAYENCTKLKRGATPFCVNHGGGKRCTVCNRAARGALNLCCLHGGGKRCKADHCTNGARTGAIYCKKHGGDKCLKCDQPAQSRKLCINHGGGTKCASCHLFCVRLKGQECWVCRVGTERAKQYEYEVQQALLTCSYLPRFSYRDQVLPCAPNLKRGDFWFLLPDYSIDLEVDENMHRHYNLECEVARLQQMHDQRPDVPLHVIRFNPHYSMPFKLEHLCERIKIALENKPAYASADGIHVEYIGYSESRMQDLETVASSMHTQAYAMAKV